LQQLLFLSGVFFRAQLFRTRCWLARGTSCLCVVMSVRLGVAGMIFTCGCGLFGNDVGINVRTLKTRIVHPSSPPFNCGTRLSRHSVLKSRTWKSANWINTLDSSVGAPHSVQDCSYLLRTLVSQGQFYIPDVRTSVVSLTDALLAFDTRRCSGLL